MYSMTQLLHELPSIKLFCFQGCFANIFHTVGGKERSHGLFCIFRDEQVNPERKKKKKKVALEGEKLLLLRVQ